MGRAGQNGEGGFIPFGRPDYSDREVAAVTRVLRSGWVGRGPETAAFEAELADAVGVRRMLAVSSCTAALYLSLKVSGLATGDEVICPSLTWCADANVVVQLGARPVFCDVDPVTLNVTAETIVAKVTERTRAVIVVHFGGLACDVNAIRAGVPRSVAIIEDAAHAFGARYSDGSPVGSAGNLTCFSFYANKNLSTGEGGAIAVADAAAAERIGWLRQGGMRADAFDRYRGLASSGEWIVEPGYKMGYSDLCASLGRVQLRRQGTFAERRLSIAERYIDRLAGVAPRVRFQADVLSPGHARHLMLIRLPLSEMSIDRSTLIRRLHRRSVGVSVHYPPLHREPVYGCRESLPTTDWLSDSLLTLPIGACITDAEADYCADQVAQVLISSSAVGPFS